ncbi:MAG: maltose acetyltransferase [Alteromonadaceae bacterium]|uniref:Sugar O-acetyltransferase n=1 Tax=Paraglaciecola mesophila TaxID=197222 RepID=A0ABU9SQF5_9ALTE|nr:maltose acetyltransferase [Alteromonadaceae bacterium]
MEKLTEKEKMLTGELYFPSNKVLQQDRAKAKAACQQFNLASEAERKPAMKTLQSIFADSPNSWIEPTFHCDYGYNIRMGRNFYANHNVVILDAAAVTFGDDVMLAPGVLISTASHPLDAKRRNKGLETARPITIGNSVWIGMGAKILDGVTIGDNAVIAAGAVVNKDVAENTVVAGVPAVAIRQIDNTTLDEGCAK